MSKQENDKMEAEQRSQINLEDLPVDEAQGDKVKAGGRRDLNDMYIFKSPS